VAKADPNMEVQDSTTAIISWRSSATLAYFASRQRESSDDG
jgi:hypothetical protein